jgi:uncharacterized repeat protein (TIGR03917 family)
MTTAVPEVTKFVGRIDGAEVSVGIQPAGAGPSPVLLRVHSPLLELLTAAYLAPDEAHGLAAALSNAALAATSRSEGMATGTNVGHARPSAAGREAPVKPATVDTNAAGGHVIVTAGEGTTTSELAAALDLVPAGSVLVDFAADTTVSLAFSAVPATPGAMPVVPTSAQV